jgi:hypothetical protein
MVLAGRTLFLAGPPAIVDDEQAFRTPDDPTIRTQLASQAAALRGELGGQIVALSAADGRLLAAHELGAAPTFDGMAAAAGRLYLTTLAGQVLCLGEEGDSLPPVSPGLRHLDPNVPPPQSPLAPEPARRVEPSQAGRFAHSDNATLEKSSFGYHLLGKGTAPALALTKLPQPLGGKISLQVRMRATTDGALRNAFLVFGPSGDEATLVKCGLRVLPKKAVILQGTAAKGKAVAASLELKEGKTYDVHVLVDLDSGQVTMKVGAATVHAKLDKPPKAVALVGFATIDAGADFSEVEARNE